MITISDKSRSAILALTEIAQHGASGPIPIMEVAEARGIPLHVLEQLFGALRRAGILQSQRGVKGGYSFGRPPADVTALEVVETIDGRLGPADAREGAESIWGEARDMLTELLGAVTVADLADRDTRLRGAPMFHI